jgi:hypothetical protein
MRLCIAWIACMVLFPVGPAQAKPVSKKAEAQAAAHTEAATAAYKAKDYPKAIAEWEASYALKPEPPILFNLAQACRLSSQLERALDYYKQYLAAAPDAPNRATVETRIAEVEKALEARMPQRPLHPPVAAAPEPTPAPAAAVTAPVDKKPPGEAPPPEAGMPKTPYQLGARIRGIFVTPAMMSPFLTASTGMESVSAGLEFIWRRPKFDVVTSLDFSYLDVRDGNYLASGNPANLDTKYVQFRGLSFLSADVSVIGHNKLGKWLEIRYGGGLGLGVVLGDVLVTNNFTGCTRENASNIAACHPQGVDLTAPDKEAQLKATENGQTDTAQNPHRHVTKDKPPVMGVVNLLVGLRFNFHKRMAAQVEVGFRNAIFCGAGFHYLF